MFFFALYQHALIDQKVERRLGSATSSAVSAMQSAAVAKPALEKNSYRVRRTNYFCLQNFSLELRIQKKILAKFINFYLDDAENIFLQKRKFPLQKNFPPMFFGNMPADNKNFSLSEDEKNFPAATCRPLRSSFNAERITGRTQKNDFAVMEAYGFDKNFSENEIVAELMKLYKNCAEK